MELLGHVLARRALATLSPTRTDLDTAYRATRYHVRAEPAFDLVIDQFSDPLQGLHAEHRVTCSAIVTACNPHSKRLSADKNAARMRQLSHDVAEAGYPTITGVAIAGVAIDPAEHPHGERWPDEPNLLILGIPLPQARELGSTWQQNAIVVAGHDAIPRLEWLS